MFADLAVAIVEQAARDYMTAKKYLIAHNCPEDLVKLRREAVSKYNTARLYGDGAGMHHYRILIDQYDMFARRQEVVDEVSDFFLDGNLSMYVDTPGEKLLEGIEAKISRKAKKGA